MTSQEIIVGDCLEMMRTMREASVDAIVTDPPYGLSSIPDIAEVLRHWLAGDDYTHTGGGFMGKTWDSFVPGPSVWKEVFRVLKPGGHALIFAGSRTVDIMGMAVRLAGFEIRDQAQWLYGSGFPKSLNVGEGRGTALKPAHEPIILARKPLIGTVAANVLEYGTGAINIDACRIGGVKRRWPANTILSHSDECVLVGERKVKANGAIGADTAPETVEAWECVDGCPVKILDEQSGNLGGGASRFFYCAKTAASEREAGLEHFSKKSAGEMTDRKDGSDGLKSPRAGAGRTSGGRANVHPTVKPISLMRYLCRLIAPPNGLIIDPFAGSGTTGCAAALEGFDFIGFEKEVEYAEIAKARIAHWQKINENESATDMEIVNYGICPQCGEMITSANGSKLRTGSLLHLECNKQLDGGNGNSVISSVPRENEFEQFYAENEDRIVSSLNARQGENMAGLPKDMAEEVGKSSSTGGGNYIRHGNFTFMIKKWFFLLSPTKERCIIVELFVIDSVAKTVYHDQVAINEVPNAIGSDCSEVANFDGKGKQSAPGNARAVVLGLFGLVEGSVTPELVQSTLDHVCNDNSPAAGMLIRCSTFPKEKRQTPGEWITGRNWECVADPRDPNGINGAAAIASRLNAFKTNPASAVNVARQQLGLAPVAVTVQAPAPQAAAPAVNSAAPAANLFAVPTPAASAPQLPAQGFSPPPLPAPAAAAPPPFTPPPAADPLAGWTAYPGQPGYFFKGQDVKSEAQIRGSIQ